MWLKWLEELYLNNTALLDHINRLGQAAILLCMLVSTIWFAGGWARRTWIKFASMFSEAAALTRTQAFIKAQSTITLWRSRPLVMRAVIGKAVTYSLANMAAMIAVGVTFPRGLWTIIIVWYFFLCVCRDLSPCIPMFDYIVNSEKRCDRLIKLLERHIAKNEGKRPSKTIDSMKGVLDAVRTYKMIGQEYLQPGSVPDETFEQAKERALATANQEKKQT